MHKTADDGPDDGAARQATAWFVRLRNPSASDADRAAFRSWLEGDPARRVAFSEVEALWKELDGPATALAAQELRQAPPPRRRSIRWARTGATFGLIAAALAAVVLWRDPGVMARLRADHATRPGERLDVRLQDGSRLYLDADSAVAESYAESERSVTVLRGRVWFDVAKDAARPFLVHADDVDVRVVGTAFGVDRDEGVVTVEHGSVSVAEGGGHLRLTGGQQVKSVSGRLAPPETVDPATALGWRRGLIVLDAAPLDEAIRELERMTGGRVIAPQADVRALRLSGVFRTNDPAALVGAMRDGLGIKVVEAPGVATLLYR